MKIVRAIGDAEVFDRDGCLVYRLFKGQEYILHDGEADRGLAGGALQAVAPVDDVLPRYGADAGDELRLALPFIGRLGDALVVSSCLATILNRHQGARITVAATPETLKLFELVDLPIACCPYPFRVEQLREHTHYLSLEDAHLLSKATSRSLADVFSEALGTPRPPAPAHLRAVDCPPPGRLPNTPHVGIQVTEPGSPRSYPAELTLQLARMLVQRGVAVWMLGQDQDRTLVTDSPPWLCNLIGRTASLQELVATVGVLDLVIGPDSFLLHLAAALEVPSLTIFTSTDPVLAGDYPAASVATASLPCSPCGQARGSCPAGQPRCQAPNHPDLRPARLCRLVLSVIRSQRSSGSPHRQTSCRWQPS